jgi:hypothetical protein
MVHVMNGLSDLRTVGSQHMISRVWDDSEPSYDDAHVPQVREIVCYNRLTVPEIAEESCRDILTTKLKMHLVVSKSDPRLLTQYQRQSRVAIC